MKIKEGYMLRFAAGAYWIVDVKQNTIHFKKPIMINECAAFIWQCIEDDMTEAQITESVSSKYEVDNEEAEEDVKSFIDSIKYCGLIL